MAKVETQLLKLLRGAHLAQLGGMRARDGPFARPLLGIRKEELRAFLLSEGQSWMEDASNSLPVYQRNRIRLQLVPMLVDLVGGEDALYSRFASLGQQSGQLAALLEGLCQENHGPQYPSPGGPLLLDVSSFYRLPEMVRYEFVWRFVANACGAMLSHDAVARIVEAVSQGETAPFTWLLGSGWKLTRQGSHLVVSNSGGQEKDKTWQAADLLVVQNVSQLHISMEVTRTDQMRGDCLDCPQTAKSSAVLLLHSVAAGSVVTLRGVLPGDRFRKAPLARNVKLTSFLHRELAVAPSARPHWPIVAIKAPGCKDVVAAVLPNLVSSDFQERTEAQRSAEVLPVLITLCWDKAWPGLGNSTAAKSDPVPCARRDLRRLVT